MKNRLFQALVVLLALVGLSGCFGPPADLKWTEDVVLPDGRVVSLKRIQHFDDQGFVDAHSFEFEHPQTKQLVKWQSDVALYTPALAQAATWQKRSSSGFFRLVALFMVQDVPHILVKPTFGGHDEHAGCPYPSMFIYRYVGTTWQQIPYAQSPVREINNNTTMDPKQDRDYISANNFKIAAGGVKVLNHSRDQHYYGLYLDKFPAQVFQCPAQKRFDLQ